MTTAGYMLPLAVIIGCMIAAAVMACHRVPLSTVQNDGQVIEEETSARLKEQRRMVKFLAALVVCWIIGNAPVIYFLRELPSITVEVSLVLVMVSHQLALPVATFVWRQRVWSRMRRFVQTFKRRKPPMVSHNGMDYPSDEEAADTGNVRDVGGPSPERPGPSSWTAGDGALDLESESAHDGINKGRCVKFDSDAVHVHQDGGDQPLGNIKEQQHVSQLRFCMQTQKCDNGCSSGKL